MLLFRMKTGRTVGTVNAVPTPMSTMSMPMTTMRLPAMDRLYLTWSGIHLLAGQG